MRALPAKGSSPSGEPLTSVMLTETAGSILCDADAWPEVGDLPIMLIILTLRLLDFVGVDVSADDVSVTGVDVTEVVADDVTVGVASSLLANEVLLDRSRKLKVNRRFSLGLCSSDLLTAEAEASA